MGNVRTDGSSARQPRDEELTSTPKPLENFMLLITRLITLLAIAFVSVSGAHAENLSEKAMFERLSALASTGNSDVQYNLGMFLNNGIGTSRDNKAAFKYFSEAAAAGHELAAYKVGCYLAGQFPGVVPVNESEALQFKLRAAEAGYALAQFDVGLMFGKQRDMANAVLWWERASHQGNVQATVALVAMDFAGKTPPDRAKGYALMLLLKESLPKAPKELLEQMAKSESQLSGDEKSEASAIRASWITGPTPLSVKAQAGINAVPALLALLER